MTPGSTPEQRIALIAQRYLEDAEYLHWNRDNDPRRMASLSGIQSIIGDFVAGTTDLKTFRDRLDAHLRQPENDLWGTRGFWMMTINQLVNNHDNLAEGKVRSTLHGLNATNVGERFEAFTRFLEEEKQRFPQRRSKLAAPGRSPFIVSLFALWLDPGGGVVVTWPTMREGLRALLDLNALPAASPLVRTWDGVRISTAQDYAAVCQSLQAVSTLVPQVTTATQWWDERFLEWVRQHKLELPEWLDVSEPVIKTFPDTPLAPVPPDSLAERIRRLRRELLIGEDVLRRVYHALILGQHVILSGPPGTGKTRLAMMLPQVVWGGEEQSDGIPASYTASVVTATDEWTPRHVIGGIVPLTSNGQVTYEIAYGCLARTIIENWNLDPDLPDSWTAPQRRTVTVRHGETETQYRGCWLVIDEFNRAPIDLALGEALTALGSTGIGLTVPTAIGPALLQIPSDFRIIGTLNTFDRHFLNQMSEALKRRFAFIEVLPPTRGERDAEQAIVIRAALERLQPLRNGTISEDGRTWDGLVRVDEGSDTIPWTCDWVGDTAAEGCFAEGWRLFEVIRLYRQFGTAQAISWTVRYLGAGLLDGLDFDDQDGWRRCLGEAFADTLADQLQILFPDEIEVLLAYLNTTDAPTFAEAYNQILGSLISTKRRNAQMLALQSIRDPNGRPYLDLAEARAIVQDERGTVPEPVLSTLFHAAQQRGALLQLTERLERLLFERTI
jgi:MoxR-like ATPase